jgi:hypothetical protein
VEVSMCAFIYQLSIIREIKELIRPKRLLPWRISLPVMFIASCNRLGRWEWEMGIGSNDCWRFHLMRSLHKVCVYCNEDWKWSHPHLLGGEGQLHMQNIVVIQREKLLLWGGHWFQLSGGCDISVIVERLGFWY